MKKVFKILGIIVGIVLIIVKAFLIISAINNKLCLDKKKLDQPIGKIVTVDGHKISVYSEDLEITHQFFYQVQEPVHLFLTLK